MKKFKIYYTSDCHGYLFPTNYASLEEKNMGILKFSSIIKKDENSLVIDGGDTIQGSPFTTYLIKNSEMYQENPIASIMNQLQYDYITLGNHDFNYGESYLLDYLHYINAKILCCNVHYDKEPHLILPYDIKIINGIKVGLIGATTQFINIWERKENIENFTIEDPFPILKKILQEIKALVDFTIVIYHGGFEKDIVTGSSLGKETGENQAYQMASELDIDLLLTGHQHLKIGNHVINNTHIIQTPHNATEVCVIHVNLESKSIDAEFISPITIKDEFLNDELKSLEQNVQNWLDQPIGKLSKAIFPKPHIEMALMGSPLANFLNTIQLELTKADISSTSLANVVKGFNDNITIRDIVSTYIYPNTLVVSKITGKQLKMALERSAEYFEVKNHEVIVSDRFLKPKIEHYNYDYFMGIDYTINLKNPIHDRIENLMFKGKIVKDDDTFTIVMNNYRASGAGGYEFYKDAEIIEEILRDIQEIVIDYILKKKFISISLENNYNVFY